MKQNSRRHFIKLSAVSAAFLGLPIATSYTQEDVNRRLESITNPPKAQSESVMNYSDDPIENVRVGFIGLGNRGQYHVELIDAIYPKATVAALCDVRQEMVTKATETIKNQEITTALYGGSSEAWRVMLEKEELDLVIISTPWDDHVPMALQAMQHGIHVALEVPAAMSIQGCWALVDTSEAMQRHCMMLENVCYGDEELWLLNMVHQGLFGDLTYGEAAYIHDLRSLMFSKTYYYQQWRLNHHIRQDGNLYPTHGLGPIAQYMGIGRGDRFEYLVSMSSKSASLGAFAQTVATDNQFHGQEQFAHGDMNNTMIKTAHGRSILVQHDVATPRPYSRINALAGTKAYHEGYPSRLSLDAEGHGHRWLDDVTYERMRKQYRHPIWSTLKDEIEQYGGHGGMDFVQIYRLIECLNQGLPLDMDVYDAVDWSVVVPLTKLSVELGSVPIQFPDFSRGRWSEHRELGIMKTE